MALSDAGLDRLRARLSARAAEVPVRWVSLDDPVALALSALEPSRSIAAAGRATYWHTRDLLERRGVSMSSASALALRVARGVVLELAGFDRKELADRLGVTTRTLRRDRALVRQLGSDAFAGGELLPPPPRGAVNRGAGRDGSARAGLRGVRAGVGQARSAGGVP